jgi:hypothetical protein
MEWQMSGGDPIENTDSLNIAPRPRGPPTEAEEVMHELEVGDYSDDGAEEGLTVREDQAAAGESELDKAGKTQH